VNRALFCSPAFNSSYPQIDVPAEGIIIHVAPSILVFCCLAAIPMEEYMYDLWYCIRSTQTHNDIVVSMQGKSISPCTQIACRDGVLQASMQSSLPRLNSCVKRTRSKYFPLPCSREHILFFVVQTIFTVIIHLSPPQSPVLHDTSRPTCRPSPSSAPQPRAPAPSTP